MRVGVGAITVESPAELARLERIAADQARIAAVLLRAALPAGSRRERLRLVGDEGAGKFGMSADDLVTAARHAVRSPHLEPLGVHAFGASNVLDPVAIADHVRATVATAADLARSVGFPLRLVDAGGGLGIPYGPGEEPLSMSGLGRALGDLAAGWAADPVTRGMRVLLEPGRYLVGPAGAYVSRVLDRKAVDGAIVAILDGGIHHLLRPALVGQAQRIELLGDREGTPTGAVTIAGPLCSGLDVLTTRAEMHAPSPGDLVAVLDAGAYGYTESMPFFLSHPIPAEVAILGGRAELIRPRIAPAEWIDRQRVPAWVPRTGASRQRSADMGPVASLD